MSDVAIRVFDLGKQYRIGGTREPYKTFREAVTGVASAPLRVFSRNGHGKEENTFWALKDVNFEIKRGEVVGVIGRNGAGKSTLLKILSRITEPTTGGADIYGRVGSLLEVGTGFHSELTGRENIYLSGAILGMRRAEIDKRFDEIVAFAEVEKFIDTPVKHYSSGMYLRLAFAVAAHLEPEILLVDEVLAVGDAAFQKKCLGKMGDVAKEGRTVLFVSHNMVAVHSLCTRALYLGKGKLEGDGGVNKIVSLYLKQIQSQNESGEWQHPDGAPGIRELKIRRVQAIANSNSKGSLISMQTSIRVETEFWVLESDVQLHITFHLVNDYGIVVLTTGSTPERRKMGLYCSSFTLPGNLLNSGGYSLKLLIVQNGNKVIFTHDNIASFNVIDLSEREHGWMGREPGAVQPNLNWETEHVGHLKLGNQLV